MCDTCGVRRVCRAGLWSRGFPAHGALGDDGLANSWRIRCRRFLTTAFHRTESAIALLVAETVALVAVLLVRRRSRRTTWARREQTKAPGRPPFRGTILRIG